MKYAFLILCLALLSSCHWVANKAKKAANKTGQIAAETGSELGNGIYRGIKKTFRNNIELSDSLKSEGITLGQVSVNSTDSTDNNILSVYFIFNQNFDRKITVRLMNQNQKEYGRLTKEIKGEKGHAKYVDFVFDKHVNIGTKGRIILQ